MTRLYEEFAQSKNAQDRITLLLFFSSISYPRELKYIKIFN
jgi:hypothetical protein